MIHSLTGLSLRFFKANKLVAVSSMVSIMLAISLIITLILFAGNAKQSLRYELQQNYGDMDLSVGYNLDQNKPFTKDLFTRIHSQPEVLQSSRVLITYLKPSSIPSEIYTVGVENDPLTQSKYHFSDHVSNTEVMLNSSLAEALNIRIGESVVIENRSFTLKEILKDSNSRGLTPDMIYLSRETVQQLVYAKTGMENQATYLLLKAKDGADLTALTNHIHQLDPTLRIDIAEEDEFVKSNLNSLQIFIQVLSALLLIITSLSLISNSDVFLYKYRNQIAIMRSIGASSSQVFKVVFIQCLFINLAGSLAGLTLALMTNQVSQRLLERWLAYTNPVRHFDLTIVGMVTVISMGIIQMFMLIPAYRSTRVLPMKIMQDNEQLTFTSPQKGKISGYILLSSGIFMILMALIQSSPSNKALQILIAALLLMFALFRLYPFYLSPLLIRILPIMKFLFGTMSFVSIKNVIPQVKKNTFMTLSISMIMIISIFGSTLFKTIHRNDQQYIKQQYMTNIIVKNRGFESTIDPAKIKSNIDKITNTESITLSTFNSASLLSGDRSVRFSYALTDVKSMQHQNFLPFSSISEEHSITLSKKFASTHHIKVGDTLHLALYSNDLQKDIPKEDVIVANIIEPLSGIPVDALMDWKNSTYINEFTRFSQVFVQATDVESTLAKLEVLKTQYPMLLQVNSYEQSLKNSNDMFYQRWSLFIAVMGVMLFMVLLGIFNTLINTVYAKRKEYAILRMLTVENQGMVKAILSQVILYIVIGLSVGTVIGIVFTYTLALLDSSSLYFNAPFLITMVCIILGTAVLIFVPIARRIQRFTLASELMQDHK